MRVGTTGWLACCNSPLHATHLELYGFAHRHGHHHGPHIPLVPLQFQRLLGVPLPQLPPVAHDLDLLAICHLQGVTWQQVRGCAAGGGGCRGGGRGGAAKQLLLVHYLAYDAEAHRDPIYGIHL